ncbi:stage II sporulation protein P [Paenibacillus gansuensis]|uniref:Stage II sporulation protein P n=1 Tax=Paenibacillus gansuensis TaxID=306542 RepID=A0ABW5PEE4_9BACL
MKWTSVTVNVGKVRRMGQSMGLLGRIYISLSLCSAVFFVLLGFGGMFQAKVNTSPASSMQGLAAAVSSRFFMDMMGMELPHAQQSSSASALSSRNITQFLFQYVTSINPHNYPQSLIAREIPLMDTDDAFVLRGSSGTDLGAAPQDYHPGNGSAKGEEEQTGNEPAPDGNAGADGSANQGNAGSEGSENGPVQAPDASAGTGNNDNPPGTETDSGIKEPVTTPTTNGKKVVFIYNSHNRESYFPALKKGAKFPEDSKTNVTLLSARLAKKLEELGVGASASKTDYASSVKNYNYNFSYKYSLKTIQTAFAQNPGIKFLFDIHRDSQGREKTTTTVKGVDYARVYFIVGHRNPDWKENEEFAAQIQQSLESKYPGISRGIWGKSSKNGNGEYNQHVSPNSILVEIGGVENTLQECYRTVDVLAKMIADVYWKAEKVNGGEKKQEPKKADDKGKLADSGAGKRG